MNGPPSPPGVRAPEGLVVVLALGSPDRGDDAAADLVADHLEELLPESARGRVEVHRAADPGAVLDLPPGTAALVVVDAVRAAEAAGSVLVRDLVADPLPARGVRAAPGGTHALPLAECLALAETLGRLPGRVRLVGVVGVGFEPMAAPGGAVRAGAARAARAVLDEITAALADAPGGAGTAPAG